MENSTEKFIGQKLEEMIDGNNIIPKEKMASKVLLSIQKTIVSLSQMRDDISPNFSISLSHLLQLYIQLESVHDEILELRRKFVL